jgi:hypothetical protein
MSKKLPVGTADTIKAAPGPTTDELEVEEWGVTLKLRSLLRGEVRAMSEKDNAAAEAYALSTACVEPELTEAEAAEILATKSFGSTELVLRKILDLSGLGASFRS